MIQILIGYNLIWPCVLFLIWKVFIRSKGDNDHQSESGRDYAIIVTAYQHINTLKLVVDSILKMDYYNYVIYIVADNCEVSSLSFKDSRVVLLVPDHILASNTKSHQFAVDHFIRPHEIITIIDSDNLVHPHYIKELEVKFNLGYVAVQGVRMAKNINTTLAALDAARDIYYNFYDGKLLFELGSSATLAGSGMAFTANVYRKFLLQNSIAGAGFDKVLQAWLVKRGHIIAFSELAKVYDEKTSRSDQLVQQRSRWINTWLKYFQKGFYIIFHGFWNLDKNQLLFGFTLIRPPLFIFILFSGLCLLISVFTSLTAVILWIISFIIFILGFIISLKYSHADKKIYKSLVGVPGFIYLQIISLTRVRNADKNSVSTSHYHEKRIEDL